MPQSLVEVLNNISLYTDERDYVMVRFPARAITLAAGIVAEVGDPFSAIIVDKDEVTLVMPSDLVAEFERRIPEDAVSKQTYRLITFDLALESSLIGFMAAVSRALADAGVSIMPYAAFSRDHLLVPFEQVSLALETLENLKHHR